MEVEISVGEAGSAEELVEVGTVFGVASVAFEEVVFGGRMARRRRRGSLILVVVFLLVLVWLVGPAGDGINLDPTTDSLAALDEVRYIAVVSLPFPARSVSDISFVFDSFDSLLLL